MLDNSEKMPGFDRFDELTNLLGGFANCSLIECKRLVLVPDSSGSLGGAEKVKEFYEKMDHKPFSNSTYLASFNVMYDNDGNWIAFLVSKGLDIAMGKIHYGKNYDWEVRLADEVIGACGIESNDDIRRHTYWDICE